MNAKIKYNILIIVQYFIILRYERIFARPLSGFITYFLKNLTVLIRGLIIFKWNSILLIVFLF